MTQKREKGKIPHSEWRKIVARYESGETIARIGRDYACTAPAIRYIIKRTGKLRGDAAAGGDPSVRSEVAPRQWQASADKLGEPVGRSDGRETGARRSTSAHSGTGGIALELRKRVTGDVASFLVALDQASAADAESLNMLQEATDCLMRSAARVRIELERSLSGHASRVEEGDARHSHARVGVSHA